MLMVMSKSFLIRGLLGLGGLVSGPALLHLAVTARPLPSLRLSLICEMSVWTQKICSSPQL